MPREATAYLVSSGRLKAEGRDESCCISESDKLHLMATA